MTSNGNNRSSKLSRRKFLLGSAATAATATVAMSSERANAFFNTFGFMKKSAGNGQTSNGYTIGQSLRFNSANSACLTRTPSAAGNLNVFTISMWFKRSKSGVSQYLFRSGASTANYSMLCIDSSDKIYFGNVVSSADSDIRSTGVLRDFGAWYHLVISNSNGTIALYLNGTAFPFTVETATNLASNWCFNSTVPHYLGSFDGGSNNAAGNFDGYLAEFYNIDGLALTPSSFGTTDTITGQWIPKKYSGTYGTNGFFLPFNDSTSTTTLGYDRQISLNDSSKNNWTPSGLATHDQVLDSPTNNFCIWNPLDYVNGNNPPTISNGNLTLTLQSGSTNYSKCRGTIAPTSGKYYFEWTPSGFPLVDGDWEFGFNTTDEQLTTSTTLPSTEWFYAGRYCYNTGSSNVDSASVYSNGQIQMCCIDLNAGKIWFGRGGSWFNSGDPANGSNACFSNLPTNKSMAPLFMNGRSGSVSVNFGQGGQTGLTYDSASGGRFKYIPPVGFKALCTANLPTPAIKNGSSYFATSLYTGNGAASRTISGLPFQADLIWNKSRSAANSNMIWDAVRGNNLILWTDTNAGDYNVTTLANGGIGSATSNGFNIISGATDSANSNQNGTSYVAWNWKASGAAGVVNNAGSLTATVSANTTSGFSIVNYSGAASVSGTSTVSPAFGWSGSLIAFSSGTVTLNGGSETFGSSCYSSAVLTNNFTFSVTIGNNVAFPTEPSGNYGNTGFGVSPVTVPNTNYSLAGGANAASGNYWVTFLGLGASQQVRFQSGDTTLGTATIDLNIGDVLAFVRIGTTLTLTRNNATIYTFTGFNSSAAWFPVFGSYGGNGLILNNVNWSVNQVSSTVGHGLSTAPSLMVVKNRTTAATNWCVYHTSLGSAKYLVLNSNAGAVSDAVIWNGTAPTSSLFSLGANLDINKSSASTIAYLWAEVAGFSKFGSYTGNGNPDGPFVYCGFKPRWVLVKCANTATSWWIYDSVRSTNNLVSLALSPNAASAEDTSGVDAIDILSNGFKFRSTTNNNVNGNTYIFAAFAEAPFKYSTAR